MKLVVYKGFNEEFLSMVKEEPLVDGTIATKLNVLEFDKKTRKQLDMALISLEESDEVWVTYSEYTLIKNRVDDAIEEDGLELIIFTNNLYPDYYPLPFELTTDLIDEIEKNLNSDSTDDCSKECQRYLTIYNTLVNVDGVYYGSFYNYEYEKNDAIVSKPYYLNQIVIEDAQVKSDIDIFVNEDVDTYLRDLARIIDLKPSVIGLKMTEGLVSKRIVLSLQAYCVANNIRLVKFHEYLEDDAQMEQELIDIARNDVHIANFTGFRSIKFYKNPDIDKEIVEISQSTLIQEIIHQAENSYNTEKGHSFRDIFITASTGAGKSVMFQIPAIYLAKHYQKLTIIIEPVKALMQDQKEKLIKNGYTRVETFNSDLISQVEKEAVLNRIKAGEVDLLYLSPETLLSYSIETIIGDKKGARSFLISPQSFTYIFNGKGVKDEGQCINKLKTCLLMLEKDFYDKYNFKVIISRPQSVFTKAYVVIDKENESLVLNSEYGKCFRFLARGRYQERQPDGSLLSDTGDVYILDLKQVWEQFHGNISFPQFKYWYFNDSSTSKDKIAIMPSIRKYFSPRQKVNIEARGDLLLNEIREKILADFEYIGNILYSEFGKNYFTTDDFTRVIKEKYGMTQARIIANSLFDLVDPNMTCVKRRSNDSSAKNYYLLSNGNFKEYMRKAIIKSLIVNKITKSSESSYSSYMSIANDEWSNIALKLLSIFDYISYEILGGEEPEIFIRLNDPQKVKNIVLGNTFYSNNYVNRAKQKHDRDVSVLLKFFNGLNTDKERWDYIEDYFLGYDVLCESETVVEPVSNVEMSKAIDKEKSYPTHQYKKWMDLNLFFDENDHIIVDKIAELGVTIPEYLSTVLKKSDWGNNILMSWPSKNVLICQQDTADHILSGFKKKGWIAYRIYEVDMEEISEVLK